MMDASSNSLFETANKSSNICNLCDKFLTHESKRGFDHILEQCNERYNQAVELLTFFTKKTIHEEVWTHAARWRNTKLLITKFRINEFTEWSYYNTKKRYRLLSEHLYLIVIINKDWQSYFSGSYLAKLTSKNQFQCPLSSSCSSWDR